MLLRGYQIKSVEQIGGGTVRQAFRMGTTWMKVGTTMTPEQIISMNPPNRGSLIDKGYIAVWPRNGEAPIIKGRRFAIHLGGGHYDVIEGRKVNDEPVTREEARELAANNPPH